MAYDPELPAGFQDADFDMAELEAAGASNAALRKRGICPHDWRQGRAGANNPALAATNSRAVRQDAIVPEGHDLCLECGKSVRAWDYTG